MIEKTFATPGSLDLDVSLPIGQIDVETVDGSETHVVLEAGSEKLLERAVVELRERGGRHELVVDLRRRSLLSFDMGRSDLRLTIRCPHGAGAALRSAAAEIEIRGRLRSLEVKTAAGDVRIDAAIDGAATVKSVSGDVRLGRVGGDLRAQLVSGDLEVAEADASVESKSVSGDQRIGSVRAGSVSLTSVSGDIEVGIRRGSRLDVDANSVSGDLDSELELAGAPAGGDGPLVELRGKTVSGDFRVVRA